MLPRAAAAFRRASAITSLTSNTMARRIPSTNRQLSLWPFLKRKNKLPPGLPVYFPKNASAVSPRSRAFRRQLAYVDPIFDLCARWRIVYSLIMLTLKNRSHVAFTAITLYLCWEIFVVIVLEPFAEFLELELENMSEEEKYLWKEAMEDAEEENEEESAVFLPFPFTRNEVKQPPYKGSDPEWLTFLALNKDQKAQKEIKFALAELIRKGVQQDADFVKLLGGEDIKLKKMWLDIIYPPEPPPIHMISGIIISSDGIFWGEREIDSLAASRLDTVIYPKAVALSIWTFVSSLCRQTTRDVAKALGFSTEPSEDTSWQTVTVNRMREQAGFGPPVKQAAKVPGTSIEKPAANLPASTNPDDVLNPTLDNDDELDPRLLEAMQDATAVFNKNWQPAKQPVSRGCVRVDGLVELQGKNAIMAVYILAWYDPRQKTFMGFQTFLKHLVHIKQKPATD
ncbi:hypothetical protein E4U55_007021 [Claviceps digitariae]|nr:hypothetical protein E4U55_007021 [Claviceps digitariae]